MKRGKFITIEGQDGAGKSTNVEVIKQFLSDAEVEYIQTREPGGTRLGEQIRELLLHSEEGSVGNTAELLLVFAARAQHIEQIIEPALQAGKWVLCDRFTDASYAYQGSGRGLPMSMIADLEQRVQGNLRPDLTLVLDLPVELGQSRAGQRSNPDRFESQQLAFKQRVRDSYLQRAEKDAQRMKIIDASRSLADVESSIITELTQFRATHD